LIERPPCEYPAFTYNDIASRRYARLPQGWIRWLVHYPHEHLREAGCRNETHRQYSELSLKLHDLVKTLYQS
jgi:hypothetical protein